MTHRLLIARHASTAPAARGQSDFDRALDATGARQLVSMQLGVAELVGPVDVVLASTATRVRQTVAGMLPADIDSARIKWLANLYLAGAGSLFEALRELPETVHELPEASSRVALCAHNPGVHQLVLDLAGDDPPADLTAGFPTGAMAAFDIDVAWAELAPRTARLVEFRLPPKRRR